MTIEDGIIELDCGFGKEIGFTSDKYTASWLWKRDNYIYISMIISKSEGKGNVSKLIHNILKKGFGVKIPTPLGKMLLMVEKNGYKKTEEIHDYDGKSKVNVWVKES